MEGNYHMNLEGDPESWSSPSAFCGSNKVPFHLESPKCSLKNTKRASCSNTLLERRLEGHKMFLKKDSIIHMGLGIYIYIDIDIYRYINCHKNGESNGQNMETGIVRADAATEALEAASGSLSRTSWGQP